MAEIIESVPNFSEGRRQEVIDDIVGAVKAVPGIRVLDVKPDADHNRTVLTIVGDRKSLVKAAQALFEKAVKHIDLRQHKGEHPRMGAVDVFPFVPISGVTTEDCIALSKEVGEMVAEKFKIPVYLYEESATRPERQNLANIRRGQFEGFAEKIKEPDWKPDFGPEEIHPSAGVVAIGARPFLIAFNVNLDTPDLSIAEAIGKQIRHIGGGLRFVKAMGVKLEERNITQVSMNLTNYKKTPIYMAVELVRVLARRWGVNIVGCQLIGMSPAEAFYDVADFYLGLENFSYDQIIEAKLAKEE
jgi:glutamate formiminotransferase